MATKAVDVTGTEIESTPSPSFTTLLVIAVVGCAAAVMLVVLAFTSDHLVDPGVRAALGMWISIPYIAAGLIAWSRRPDSRFGLLMIVAGFGTILSLLTWANSVVLYSIGQAFDFVPPVLLIHLILTFPTGRLERPLERWIVTAAYFLGVGLALIRLMLGGVDPPTLFQVVSDPEAALVVERIILLGLSALCLAGIGVLALRRRERGRPLRRWVALLIDSFALGLLMIALLFMAGTFGWPAFETIRRMTFLVIGAAPIAFLIGLLHARLTRSSVGDLMVDLQKDRSPGYVRDALARALRDPSLTLAFWLPEFGRYVDLDGRPVEPTAGSGRASTPIDRDWNPRGDTRSTTLHFAMSPSCSPPSPPAPGWHSTTLASKPSFGHVSRSCGGRELEFSKPGNWNGNGWSATCTMVPSRGSLRSLWSSDFSKRASISTPRQESASTGLAKRLRLLSRNSVMSPVAFIPPW